MSKKWGFTKYDREEYEKLREENRLANDGCNVKYRPEHGPLDAWRKVQTELYSLWTWIYTRLLYLSFILNIKPLNEKCTRASAKGIF